MLRHPPEAPRKAIDPESAEAPVADRVDVDIAQRRERHPAPQQPPDLVDALRARRDDREENDACDLRYVWKHDTRQEECRRNEEQRGPDCVDLQIPLDVRERTWRG